MIGTWSSRLGITASRKVATGPGRAVKLVHNIVLSMPAPTPADKLLTAARIFAREKFGLKHRNFP